MSTVGQARTRSPWGTLDQGGNVVEITDTICPTPPLGDTTIVWRRWHGGVVTATAYQMWLSAVGVTPQTVPGYAVNPWRGIRLVARGVGSDRSANCGRSLSSTEPSARVSGIARLLTRHRSAPMPRWCVVLGSQDGEKRLAPLPQIGEPEAVRATSLSEAAPNVVYMFSSGRYDEPVAVGMHWRFLALLSVPAGIFVAILLRDLVKLAWSAGARARRRGTER